MTDPGPADVAKMLILDRARRERFPTCLRCDTPLSGIERQYQICGKCDDEIWDGGGYWPQDAA
jgi:hypothetical protein